MSDRLLIWLIVVAVILVIGSLVYRSSSPDKKSEISRNTQTTEMAKPRSTQMKARIDSCRREKDSKQTLAHGYIENIGNADLRYVTLEIQWQDHLGTTIEANEIYVLRDEALAPGKRKEFVGTTKNRKATRCNVRKVDWW